MQSLSLYCFLAFVRLILKQNARELGLSQRCCCRVKSSCVECEASAAVYKPTLRKHRGRLESRKPNTCSILDFNFSPQISPVLRWIFQII